MVPTCFEPSFNGPAEDELQIARVDNISMRALANQRRVSVRLDGVGSGKVPLRATINGKWCSQVAWGPLSKGLGSFNLAVPQTARKLSLYSADSQGSIHLRSSGRNKRRVKQEKMCAELLQAVK